MVPHYVLFKDETAYKKEYRPGRSKSPPYYTYEILNPEDVMFIDLRFPSDILSKLRHGGILWPIHYTCEGVSDYLYPRISGEAIELALEGRGEKEDRIEDHTSHTCKIHHHNLIEYLKKLTDKEKVTIPNEAIEELNEDLLEVLRTARSALPLSQKWQGESNGTLKGKFICSKFPYGKSYQKKSASHIEWKGSPFSYSEKDFSVMEWAPAPIKEKPKIDSFIKLRLLSFFNRIKPMKVG